MAATKALVRTTFKGLLKAAGRLDALGASIPAEIAKLPIAVAPAAATPLTFTEFVSSQYKAHMTCAPGPQLDALVDTAMQSLVMANKRIAALEAGAHDVKPESVQFSVGQVFRHKIFGYRAVIIGWDETCKAGEAWVAATGTARLPHGTSQPFYRCLVDIRDRPQAQVSYVAQDNIDLLTPVDGSVVEDAPSAMERMVIHPLVTRHFDTFRMHEGFYVPTARVMESYPDETPTRIHTARLARHRVGASDSESESDIDSLSGKAGHLA